MTQGQLLLAVIAESKGKTGILRGAATRKNDNMRGSAVELFAGQCGYRKISYCSCRKPLADHHGGYHDALQNARKVVIGGFLLAHGDS